MSFSNEKKSRGSNFTIQEKQILIQLINGWSNVLENKKSDLISLKKKNLAWENILCEYNSQAVTGTRTLGQIKLFYKNFKNLARKKVAEENKEINKTGGGSYKPILGEVGAQILATVRDQVTPLSNPYDDAALYFDDPENPTVSQVPSITENSQPNTILDMPAPLPTSYSMPSSRKEPRKNHKKKTIKKNIKKNEIDYKKKYFRAKYFNALLQRKYMKEEHQITMEIKKMEKEKLMGQ